MRPAQIVLPAGQNWSCHGCTECCRGRFAIGLSPAERERISGQGWTKADGVDPAGMFVVEGGQARLAHSAAGACVFLNPEGLCRIHAKFGEDAKPLACRVYPLVIHPAGRKLAVGLRFSCPSAVANRGKPLSEQGPELDRLSKLVVPPGYTEGTPPPIAGGAPGEWPDFLRFVRWIDQGLAAPGVPISRKLRRVLHWLRMIEEGSLERVAGNDAEEMLEVLARSAVNQTALEGDEPPPPSRLARCFLRMMVLEHARTVGVGDLRRAGRYRWRMLWYGARFARAGGRTPALPEGLASVPFAEVERPFGAPSADVEALLTRYFRVKVQSLHFCGPAFHQLPLIGGFRSLAALLPVILWLSRWQALSDGRHALTEKDVARAISLADHHHGYSRHLNSRVRLLQRRGDIERLCTWYSR